MSKVLFGILLGIAITIVVVAGSMQVWEEVYVSFEAGTVILVIAAVTLAMFIFSKIAEYLKDAGYKEDGELAFEHNLEPMKTVGGSTVCLISEKPYSYIFFTQADTPFSTDNEKGYVCNTINYGEDVTIIEEDDCKNPRIVAYTYKVKKNWYAFFLGDTEKYKCYFYIPRGSYVLDF